MITCSSKYCRTQTVRMAFVKGAFVGVIQTCSSGLYTCDHPKRFTNDTSTGGVRLGGTAIITETEYDFYDSFTSLSAEDITVHTPEVGGAWTKSGTGDYALTVENGYLALTGSSDQAMGHNDFGVANALMEFYMSFNYSFSSGMTIDFNKLNDDNKWIIYHSPPYVQLNERTSGVSTERGLYTIPDEYTSMKLGIRTNGDTIQVYVDDVLRITYTVSNRPNKTNSLFSINWFSMSGFLHFDKVTALQP